MKLEQNLIALTGSLLLCGSPAMAWLGAGTGKRASGAQISEIEVQSFGGTDEVHSLLADMEADAALRTRDSTALPPSNPSCFFLALSTLPSSSPCEALSRSDSARSDVAASMAICEVNTAGDGEGKVPRECSDWKKSKSKVGVCVEALARSPQHWSSYSGYLREVVTLCSSYRRWADLEKARDLHASTATTFAAFLEQLKSVEEARARREAHEQEGRSSLSQNLGALQAVLSSLGAGLVDAHTQHFLNLTQLDLSLNSTAQTLHHRISSLRVELALAAEEAAARSEAQSEELGAALQEVGLKHAHGLETTFSSFRNDLAEALAGLQGASSQLFAQLSTIRAQLEEAGLDLRAANEDIASAVKNSKALSHALGVNVNLATRLRSEQTAATRLHLEHAHELSLALTNLTKRMEEHHVASPLSSIFGLQEAYWGLSWITGLARDGSGGLLLLPTVFAVLVGFSQTASRAMTLVSTLAALYPLLASALALFRLSKGLRRSKSSFPTPHFPSTLPPSNRSTEALIATHFALAFPPASLKAGIGSPGRTSRASMGAVSSLYAAERGLARLG